MKILIIMEFGVIIHWGIYSVPAFNPRRKNTKTAIYNGSEWYQARLLDKRGMYRGYTIDYHKKNYNGLDYYDFIEKFETNAKSWDPKIWIDLIKKSGASYAILTVKHHDGVVLYPSTIPGKNTKRNYIKEFTDACRIAGLSVGLYYSLMEFTTERYSKGKIKVQKYINNVLIPQLKEIVINFNPDILWTDGDWHHTMETWHSEKFLDWLFSVNPKIIINDRWGKDFKSIRDSKYKKLAYCTGTDRLTDSKESKWEYVGTIGLSWGYDQFQLHSDYKTASEIKLLYNKLVTNGCGRFTLNIGPKSDGSLDPYEENVLKSL